MIGAVLFSVGGLRLKNPDFESVTSDCSALQQALFGQSRITIKQPAFPLLHFQMSNQTMLLALEVKQMC
jgi:hypothetical protein